MINHTAFLVAGFDLTALPSLAPSLSAAVAVVALAVNVFITTAQRNGDNRTAANSVLLSLGSDNKTIVVTNGGKSPILDATVTANGVTLLPDGETKVYSIAIAAGDKGVFSSAEVIGGLFPHQILATFSDVRGKYWKREPNRPATKTKK